MRNAERGRSLLFGRLLQAQRKNKLAEGGGGEVVFGRVEKGSVVRAWVNASHLFSPSTLTSALGRWGFSRLQHDSSAPSGAMDEGLEGSPTTFISGEIICEGDSICREGLNEGANCVLLLRRLRASIYTGPLTAQHSHPGPLSCLSV